MSFVVSLYYVFTRLIRALTIHGTRGPTSHVNGRGTVLRSPLYNDIDNTNNTHNGPDGSLDAKPRADKGVKRRTIIIMDQGFRGKAAAIVRLRPLSRLINGPTTRRRSFRITESSDNMNERISKMIYRHVYSIIYLPIIPGERTLADSRK